MPSVRATYELIADSFAASRRDPWPEVLAFLGELPAGSRVLDVGCGGGRHVAAAASLGHRAVGVDFSRRLLRIAHASSTPDYTRWVEGEATVLPVRSGAFDACLSVAVLHHLPTPRDRVRALAEVRRALRPRGRALISVWDRESPRFRSARDSGRDAAEHSGDVDVPWTLPDGRVVSRYYHLFRDEELAALIIDSGLEEERFFRSAGNLFATATRHG